MTLPPRLAAVAAFVPSCTLLADIGTDHAYIPIHLVRSGVAQRAIASDVSAGPARIARRNIETHGLGDKIAVSVGYGLDTACGADVIVIAGMGGKLVCSIIDAGLKTARAADTLIIQPMTNDYEVRKFLCEKGFTIIKETLAKEERKLYNIMVVRNGKETVEDDLYHHIGIRLIEGRDPLLGQYLSRKIRSLDVAIANMTHSVETDAKRRAFTDLRRRLTEVYHAHGS